MKHLRGKNCVVTGAASGIGRATAVELAYEGMNVVIADVNEEGMEETAGLVRAQTVNAAVKKTDVSKKEEVKALVDFAIEEMGSIDLMMNNAGVGMSGEIRDLSLENDWEWIMGINLWGPIYGCHYVLPHMIERGGGHIVNVSSAAGFFSAPGMAPYCTTKFGVVGMSEVLRSEVARLGIGVTCVCPAFVKTPIFEATKTVGMKEMDMSLVNKYWGQEPSKTAKLIVQGIKKNKGLLLPTIDAKGMYQVKRLFPRLYSGLGLLSAKNMDRMRAEE